MTQDNELGNGSLEDLFGDTEESTKLEKEILQDLTADIAKRFIPISMKLKEELSKPTLAENREVRQISFNLPPSVWEGLELMQELFASMSDHSDEKMLPKSIRDAVAFDQETFNLTVEESLLSQASLDNLISFINTMAQISLVSRIQSAMSSPESMEEMNKILNDVEEQFEASKNKKEEDEDS